MDWYEWVFSGVGVFFLSILIAWIVNRRRKRAAQGGDATVGLDGYARAGHGGGPNGGDGGKATVGGSGVAIGGDAGGGGPGGRGGAGGGGAVHGNGLVVGGEGGEAGQADRGGRGGRSPFEAMGIPNEQLPDGTWLWDRGRGGDGAAPEEEPNPDGPVR